MYSTNLHIRLKRNLCITYCCIIWLIYTPICLYGIIKFYRHRQNIVISKRHSVITICLLICMLLLLSIFLPFTIIAFSNSFLNIEFLKWGKYGFYVSFYPMIILLFQIIYMFIWRQWLYYKDISLIKFSSNQEWTDLLNPPKNLQFTNKLLSSFNFCKIMLFLFCITTISIICWSIIFSSNNDNINTLRSGSTATAFFWCCLCSIFLLILRCITPKFEDGFFIRKEMIYWIYIIFIVALLIITDLFIDYFLLLNNSKFHVIVTMTNYFLLCTATFLIICISSHYVIHKNKCWIIMNHMQYNHHIHIDINDEAQLQNITEKIISHCETPSHTQTTPKPLKSQHNYKYSITSTTAMLNALQNPVWFDQFMAHLMKEFSVEIMLSFIEFTQFQQRVYEFAEMINEFEMDANFTPIDPEWRILFDFILYPAAIPNSSIVYDELETEEIALCYHLGLNHCTVPVVVESREDICGDYEYNYNQGGAQRLSVSTNPSVNYQANRRNTGTKSKGDYHKEIEIKKIEFLIRAHKLYSKYISLESKLKINISFKERNKFIRIMGKFNKWVNTKERHGKQLKMLFKLFEKPMEQMFVLLMHSFKRFKEKYSLTDYHSRSPVTF